MDMSKFYIVRHCDMDGVGTEILLRNMIKIRREQVEIISHSEGYDTVNQVVSDILDKMTIEDYLMITDISVNPKVAERINTMHSMGFSILLVDHHPKLEHLEVYPWAILSKPKDKKCGTKLLSEVIELHLGVHLGAYARFIELVNDYDLWLHTDPNSKQLNRLYGIIGDAKFLERFMDNPEPTFTSDENYLLEIEDIRMKRYFDKAMNRAVIENNIAYVFASQYLSELGHEIIQKFNVDIVYLIDMEGKKVSLRSKPEVDCSVIAKKHGGGGHKNSCGYELSIVDVGHCMHELTTLEP